MVVDEWRQTLVGGYWLPAHDADPRVIALYRRHYSANLRKNHRFGISGPAERLVLLTVKADALFVWRLVQPPEKRISKKVKPDMRRIKRGLPPSSKYFGNQVGVMCGVFRNEGHYKSSDMILEAEQIAWRRWPGQRLFTYVWDSRVKSVNPGYCFKVAGWRYCGRNKDGRLSILEKLPCAD